jgi:hypothetical protein
MRPVLSCTSSSMRAETPGCVTSFSSETGGNSESYSLTQRPEAYSLSPSQSVHRRRLFTILCITLALFQIHTHSYSWWIQHVQAGRGRESNSLS